MKTPEEIAREALGLSGVSRMGMDTGWLNDIDRVAAAIAAERAKADALAQALREIAKDDDLVAASDGAFGLQAYRRCRDQARAALAAYESDGETGG